MALRQKIQKGWHTYWRNAGDTGEPTQISGPCRAGWKAGEFAWPTPRASVGPLVNFGYKDEVLLPMTLTAPAGARPGPDLQPQGRRLLPGLRRDLRAGGGRPDPGPAGDRSPAPRPIGKWAR